MGIVRTEREVAGAFLRADIKCRFVFFDPANNFFRSIARDEAMAIVQSAALESRSSNACTDFKEICQYTPTNFNSEDVLISAGLVWDSDFLSTFYRRRQEVGCRLVQIIYDIIPVFMPEYCVEGMFDRFPSFVLNALWSADRIYGISENTCNDIIRYAQEISAPTTEVARIRLGCDLGNALSAEKPQGLTSLIPGKFVLYVSTIEPRKNHMMAYQVWRRLIREHPDLTVPLVFIGHKGWNSADFLKIISMDAVLNPEFLFVVSGVDDLGLQWLYENCSFTLYPSLYEGWGLPVAESLAHGKVCLSSSASSLPEVGQGCAVLIDPLNFEGWYNAVLNLLSDPSALAAANARVVKNYRPTNWTDCADAFCDDVVKWASSSEMSR